MSKNYELLRQNGNRTPARDGKDRATEWDRGPVVLAAQPVERPAGSKAENLDFDLHGILSVLRRRKHWIAGCTLAMLVAAALVCIFMTPRYKAESKIEVLKQDQASLGLSTQGQEPGASDALDFNITMQTQLAVLKSDALAWQVLQEVQSGQTGDRPIVPIPAPVEAGNSPADSALPSPPPGHAELLRAFKSNLSVDAMPGTRLIVVGYLDRDAKRAAQIVNRLMADFIEYNFRARYQAVTRATVFLNRQLVDLKRQVEQDQARAVELEKQSGIFGEDEHHNIVLTRLEQLNNEVTAAETDRVLKEAVYKLTRSGNPESVAGLLWTQTGAGSPDLSARVAVLNSLRQQEASLTAEYADAAAKYGPEYPRLVQLKERLGSVRSSIAAEIRNLTERSGKEFELAASRESAARKAFTEQKAVAAQMNDKATDYLIARHEADSSRDLYDHLLGKVKEAGVVAGLHSSDLQVVDPARIPSKPARPNVPVYLALGGLAGMFLGGIAAFVIESADETIRDVEEAECSNSLPVLGIVPQATLGLARPATRWLTGRMERGNGHNSTQHSNLFAGFADPAVGEAFRSARTSLLFGSLGERPEVFLITSAVDQEGKTFTSLNLAAALARKRARVLLVDADLRRGTLSATLLQQSNPGLSETLSTDAAAPYLELENTPGLFFMPCGNSLPSLSELLESERMDAVLAGWREEFDYVVVDTPPVLAVTDAVVLSTKVDAVVVVARIARTNRQAFARAVRILRSVKPAHMAMLVNGVDLTSPSYYRYAATYSA
ncbi:MAG: polysaccharide biosynthesis tyrosine autokinase [Acidobacteria bacterium]|nr:polysaccharide biosynthesis tyrosine autokinase [Acidobacteriota bacterium]